MGSHQWAERHQFWQVNPLFYYQGDLRDRGREIFFSTMVLQIYYVTSCVPTFSFVLRSQFCLDPLYSQATWYDGTGQS